MEIKFNNTLDWGYTGRNGDGKSIGLDFDDFVWSDDNSIQIRPINSRNELGRAVICIPKEHIQDLIDTLEKFK